MYYELVILGTLMGGPFHGYLIAKIVQNILGPHGKMSAGRLYPLLARLEADGVIEAEPSAEPPPARQRGRVQAPSRSYRITAVGRGRFRAVMLDTTSYLSDYQRLFLQKVTYFSFLQPAERLHLIEHYLDYCRALVRHGDTQAAAVAAAGEDPRALGGMTAARAADLLIAMRHRMDQWRQELRWCEGLREQAVASLAAPAATTASPDGQPP